MIHPVRMGIFDFADAVTLQQYIGALNTIRENILNLYTKKTGQEKDEVAAWMDATSSVSYTHLDVYKRQLP